MFFSINTSVNPFRYRFALMLVSDNNEKTFEISDIARLSPDFPERGSMNDKQYKPVVEQFIKAFVAELSEMFDAKLIEYYSTTGELRFENYGLARVCGRYLTKKYLVARS